MEELRIVFIPSREQFGIFYVPKREHAPTREYFRIFCA